MLPGLVGTIEDKWATVGDPVNFTCQFNSSNDAKDLDIVWKVGSDEFCGDFNTTEQCSMNTTHSIFQINSTASFTMGTYQVQCILKHRISKPFLDDPSFRDELLDDIVKEATLTLVEPSGTIYTLLLAIYY